MKRLVIVTLAVVTSGLMGLGTDTQASTVAKTKPQVRIEIGQRRHDRDFRRNYRNRDWNARRFRSVTQTRIVRYGWRTYRETYVVRYLPNGQTETTLISRERIS